MNIETANLDMDAEGLSFSDPKGWRTSCVCIHNSTTGKNNIYVPKENYLQIARICGGTLGIVYPFEMLEYHLNEWRDDGYTLLTHNGLGFDFPILSKSIKDGGVGGCASLLKKWPKEMMMDTSAVLSKATGERYRLNHLIHGLLGEEQSKLMDAANAPKEWAKGNYEDVIRFAVYLTAGEEGEFRAIGKESYRPVPIREFLKSWSDMWEH